MTITVKGYAKINLHLDINGIMNDGYHSVETVMQSLDLYDEVSVSLTDSADFFVECNAAEVPSGDGNIAVRAAKLFMKRAKKEGGVAVKIKKNIPIAAGLAGGSADGAATLVGLNELFDKPFTVKELCAMGSELGADVPFCIVCGTVYADGRGDVLHDFPQLSDDVAFVIACGGEGVSTPWAYRKLDTVFDNFNGYEKKGTEGLKNALEKGDRLDFCRYLFNIFEEPVLKERPTASQLRRLMIENGAVAAMMSGSGPSVFGVFDDVKKADLLAASITNSGCFARACRPTLRRNTNER